MLSVARLLLGLPEFGTKYLLALLEDCGVDIFQGRWTAQRPRAVCPAVGSENSRGGWGFGVTIPADGTLTWAPEVPLGAARSSVSKDNMIQASGGTGARKRHSVSGASGQGNANETTVGQHQ